MSTVQTGKRIFISHLLRDEDLARDIARRLREAGFAPVWAKELPTRDYRKALRGAIKDVDGVIVLVTPASLDSPWPTFEVGMAEGFDKMVVPVLAGVGQQKLPPLFQSYQAVPFDRLDKAIEELAEKLGNKP